MEARSLKFANFKTDLWLGDRLGKDAFHLVVQTNQPEALSELQSWNSVNWQLHFPALAFCDVRVPCHRLDWLRSLERIGFKLVDTQVTLELLPTLEVTSLASAQEVTIHTAEPGDRDAIISIASRAFQYSRFHLDPLVNRRTADRIKASWIENCCNGKRGDRLWVAKSDGQVRGFLASLVSNVDGEVEAVIDLTAVCPSAQGRGIGRSLTSSFIQHYQQCRLLRVGSQAANIKALNLYQSLGFAISQSQYLMHYHASSLNHEDRKPGLS